MSDYLAVIYVGSMGSAHGRASERQTAIKNAMKALRDWEKLGDIPEQEINISVWDVDGYDEVVWGTDGIWGTNSVTGVQERISASRLPEIVYRKYKPKRRKT